MCDCSPSLTQILSTGSTTTRTGAVRHAGRSGDCGFNVCLCVCRYMYVCIHACLFFFMSLSVRMNSWTACTPISWSGYLPYSDGWIHFIGIHLGSGQVWSLHLYGWIRVQWWGKAKRVLISVARLQKYSTTTPTSLYTDRLLSCSLWWRWVIIMIVSISSNWSYALLIHLLESLIVINNKYENHYATFNCIF